MATYFLTLNVHLLYDLSKNLVILHNKNNGLSCEMKVSRQNAVTPK